MSRFVILSFAFMGLGFYELSGGSDFQPGTTTTAAALGLDQYRSPPPQTRMVARADTSGISLTDVSAAAPPPAPEPEPGVMLASLETPTVARGIADPEKAAVFTADPQETAPPDLREVNGSRVNLRAGPGTSYDVLTSLGRGAQVEVLQDTGDGWVELRVLDTDRTGWMADFLVTASVD